jgi:hypothetical protein
MEREWMLNQVQHDGLLRLKSGLRRLTAPATNPQNFLTFTRQRSKSGALLPDGRPTFRGRA